MVRARVLFDTNILIDYLSSRLEARLELDRYADRAISIISWIEVMAGTTARDESLTREFLLNFEVMPLDAEIAERAFQIRRSRKIKVPDAIIQATAESAGRLLVSRNGRDFPARMRGVRNPYKF